MNSPTISDSTERDSGNDQSILGLHASTLPVASSPEINTLPSAQYSVRGSFSHMQNPKLQKLSSAGSVNTRDNVSGDGSLVTWSNDEDDISWDSTGGISKHSKFDNSKTKITSEKILHPSSSTVSHDHRRMKLASGVSRSTDTSMQYEYVDDLLRLFPSGEFHEALTFLESHNVMPEKYTGQTVESSLQVDPTFSDEQLRALIHYATNEKNFDDEDAPLAAVLYFPDQVVYRAFVATQTIAHLSANDELRTMLSILLRLHPPMDSLPKIILDDSYPVSKFISNSKFLFGDMDPESFFHRTIHQIAPEITPYYHFDLKSDHGFMAFQKLKTHYYNLPGKNLVKNLGTWIKAHEMEPFLSSEQVEARHAFLDLLSTEVGSGLAQKEALVMPMIKSAFPCDKAQNCLVIPHDLTVDQLKKLAIVYMKYRIKRTDLLNYVYVPNGLVFPLFKYLIRFSSSLLSDEDQGDGQAIVTFLLQHHTPGLQQLAGGPWLSPSSTTERTVLLADAFPVHEWISSEIDRAVMNNRLKFEDQQDIQKRLMGVMPAAFVVEESQSSDTDSEDEFDHFFSKPQRRQPSRHFVPENADRNTMEALFFYWVIENFPRIRPFFYLPNPRSPLFSFK